MSICPRCQRPLEDEEPYICCAGQELRWRCADCHKVSEGFAFPYGLCPFCKGKLELLDLPGSYSLDSSSPDEEVTRQVVTGEFAGQAQPDLLVIVLDAANLEQHLVFAQEVIALGRPTVAAVNSIGFQSSNETVVENVPVNITTSNGNLSGRKWLLKK